MFEFINFESITTARRELLRLADTLPHYMAEPCKEAAEDLGQLVDLLDKYQRGER